MPSIACGKKRLLEIGISRMSSTTPMRKSSRMNAQPTSAAHRYRAFSPASATTNPQKTPSNAIPANTNPGETRRSKTRDILVRAVQKALNTVPTTRTPVSLNSRMTLVVSARRVWSLRASMTTLPARKATFCASA